jgi:hypothetical protein
MSANQQKIATLGQSAPVNPPREPKAALAPSPDGHARKPRSVSEEKIRLQAYQNWEAAGKPPGNGVQFWLEAEREHRTA